MDLDGFANVRARLQRLSDARFFSGWVDQLGETVCRVRLSATEGIQPDESFLVELHGEEFLASFQATACAVDEDGIRLQINDRIQFRRAMECARYRLRGIYGTVNVAGAEMDACIVDISRGGLGVVVPKPVTRHSNVVFRLRTRAGELKGEGEVQYCRPAPAGVGGYRIGLKLADFHRLEKARWLRGAGSMLASLPSGSRALACDADQTFVIASAIGGRFVLPRNRFAAKSGLAGRQALLSP